PGTAVRLDVALMGVHVAQLTRRAEVAKCFEMATEGNARIMNLPDYGLRPGAQASLVVLDAGNPTEALRLRPARLAVVSKGRVVARAPRGDHALSLAGRPPTARRRAPQPP